LRLPRSANSSPQRGYEHMKGFSPVCVRTWRLSAEGLMNVLRQPGCEQLLRLWAWDASTAREGPER
jgi:hypothetical protein